MIGTLGSAGGCGTGAAIGAEGLMAATAGDEGRRAADAGPGEAAATASATATATTTGGGCPLLVVVVNYESARLAIDCLASLEPELAGIPGARVALVENASGEAEILARALDERGWRGWVELIEAERNGGFSAGNNRAIVPAMASGDPPGYVLLLNPDTVVRPGGVRELLAFMDAHPGAGIAGSRLEFPDGEPQRSAFRFPSPLGELEGGLRLGLASRLLGRWVVAPPVPPGDEPVPTDWVAGASMIVRREVFEAVGPLDEAYFMYFEEVDFCRRAAAAGWPCWYVPRSRVVHLVGQSSGVTDWSRPRRRRPPYWFASRRRYFRAHFGAVGAAAADLLFIAGFASYRLRRRLSRKPDTDPDRLLADFVRYSLRPPAPGHP